MGETVPSANFALYTFEQHFDICHLHQEGTHHLEHSGNNILQYRLEEPVNSTASDLTQAINHPHNQPEPHMMRTHHHVIQLILLLNFVPVHKIPRPLLSDVLNQR
jgi:hypothetical protein